MHTREHIPARSHAANDATTAGNASGPRREPLATGAPGGCQLLLSTAARNCGQITMCGGHHKIRTSSVAGGETDIFHFEDSEKVFMRF